MAAADAATIQPMARADEAPLRVLEDVTRTLPTLDPRERRSECGRLILAADALHYVPGWEVHDQRADGRHALRELLELISRAIAIVDTRAEGVRLLADVQALAPADQVRRIAGSVTVPDTDIASAARSFFTSVLKVVTEARGEVFKFQIARPQRHHVQAWLTELRRRS